ncbi:L-seryl-tRNA(Sec) selenium transferase [Collibacillus ludicampi]|uniref:L-seryl-tRNA(Sec) selenium transferase n=1 Tax=Collibacillus ludicampi TaxID=2771369 RepID=A0AAV4LA63_9BACL|nr:L-seryl-tRNA(Sec) selenium transferase [Collibacillus ludicampi]GIM44676.1 L-seryl-tRNA(Sec) selenium transferase [Collibacillus ludicampi]
MSNESRKQLLRNLPAVHRVIVSPECEPLLQEYGHTLVSKTVSEVITTIRNRMLAGEEQQAPTMEQLVEAVERRLTLLYQTHYRRVINATGVVLHTNLGRAPLASSAVDILVKTASGYTNLELNLDTGERGTRYAHVEDLICRLTGAEAALVVNNNAAAVLLVLREMAKGKKVVISRGQLVEIGGSFRVSEVMAESGAILHEVGTTNKTHGYDYERAIDEETALVMKVHTSNFRIVGFTHQPILEELVRIAHERNVPVYEDLGSGSLLDLRKYGIGDEPTVSESVKAGVDIISFSGDKLLGATQAGIIIGKKEYIKRLKRNQLTRALRVDKLTLAALEATLRLYLDEEKAIREIPTLYMLTRSFEDLREAAEELASGLRKIFHELANVSVVDGVSQVGGGSLPTEELPTLLVAVKSSQFSLNALAEAMRLVDIPVMAMIRKEALLFDVRTIFRREIQECIESVRRAFANIC